MASEIRWRQITKGSHSTTDSIMHAKQTLKKIYLRYFTTVSTGPLLTLYRFVFIFVLFVYPCTAQKPGCNLIGYTRPVKILGCREFNVTLNACRGFCQSYAIPSPQFTLDVNRRHRITSRAECCSITDTEDKPVWVDCVDGEQLVVFKSARKCSCSVCRS